MALRPTKSTQVSEQEEPAQEAFSQRKRPAEGQFRLQVDRQTKSSYATYEAAEVAGRAIKTTYPVVQVSVYDAVQCVNRMIELS